MTNAVSVGARAPLAALGWIALGLAAAALVAGMPPVAELCSTDLLHTVGPWLIAFWALVLLVATPFRLAAVGASLGRVCAHGLGLGACIYFGYFLLFDSDLLARDDELWAFAAALAVGVPLMRLLGSPFAVRSWVTLQLRREPSGKLPLDTVRAFSSGVLRFRTTLEELQDSKSTRLATALRHATGSLLTLIAPTKGYGHNLLRAADWLGRAHGLTCGTNPGRSRAVTRAFEDSTDRATRDLRVLLGREGEPGSNRLHQQAMRVVSASTAELRLETMYQQLRGPATTPQHRWAERAAVSLELAIIAGRRGKSVDTSPIETAFLECLRATGNDDVPESIRVLAHRLLGGSPVPAAVAVDDWLALGEACQLEAASFLRITLVGRLLNERYLNWALSVARDLPQSQHEELLAASRAMEHEAQAELLRSTEGLMDPRDLGTRSMSAAITAEESDYPAPRVAAALPWKGRPRHGTATVGRRAFGLVDTGAGSGVVSAAALCALSLVVGLLVHSFPLGHRLKPLRDIHRRENYATFPIADAAVNPKGSQLFLATLGAALQVVDTETFRIRTERGLPPMGPGHDRLSQVAVGPDGALLATTQADRPPMTRVPATTDTPTQGVSARRVDGLWTTIVGASTIPWFTAERIRHATATSRHLLFFLDSVAQSEQLVAYGVSDRTLRPCIPASGTDTLSPSIAAVAAVPDGSGVIVLSASADGAVLSRMSVNAHGSKYSLQRLTKLPEGLLPADVSTVLAAAGDQVWLRTTHDSLLRWGPEVGWQVEMEGDTGLNLDCIQHVVAGGTPTSQTVFLVRADDSGAVTEVRARVLGDKASRLSGPNHRWQRWAATHDMPLGPSSSHRTQCGRRDPRPVAALLAARPVLFLGTRGPQSDGFVAWSSPAPTDSVHSAPLEATWIPLPDGMRLMHYDGTAEDVVAVVQRNRTREVYRWKWAQVLAAAFGDGERLRRTLLPTQLEANAFRDNDVLAVGSIADSRTMVILKDGRFLVYDGGLCGVVPLGDVDGGSVYGRLTDSSSQAPLELRAATITDGKLWCIDREHRVLAAPLDAAAIEGSGVLVCHIISAPSRGPDLRTDPVQRALPCDNRIALILKSGAVWTFRPGAACANWSQQRTPEGVPTRVRPDTATLITQSGRLGPPIGLDFESNLVVLTEGWSLGDTIRTMPLIGVSPTPSACFALARDGAYLELTLTDNVIDAVQVLPPPKKLSSLPDASAIAGLDGGLLVGHSGGLRFFNLRTLSGSDLPLGSKPEGAKWRFLRFDSGDSDGTGLWAEYSVGPGVFLHPVVQGTGSEPNRSVGPRVGAAVRLSQEDTHCLAGDRLVVHRSATGSIEAYSLTGGEEVLRQPSLNGLSVGDALRRTTRVGSSILAVDRSGLLMAIELSDGHVVEVDTGYRNCVDVSTCGEVALALDSTGAISRLSRSRSRWLREVLPGVEALSLVSVGSEVLATTKAGGLVRVSHSGVRVRQELPGFVGAHVTGPDGITAALAANGQLLLAGKAGIAIRSDTGNAGLLPISLPSGVSVKHLQAREGAVVLRDHDNRFWLVDLARCAVAAVAQGLPSPTVRGISQYRSGYLALSTDRLQPLWAMPDIGARASPILPLSCKGGSGEVPAELLHVASVGNRSSVVVADSKHIQRIDLDAHTYASFRIPGLSAVQELRGIGDWCLATWTDSTRSLRMSVLTEDGTVRTLAGSVVNSTISGNSAYALVQPRHGGTEMWGLTGNAAPERIASIPRPPNAEDARPQQVALPADQSGLLLLDSGGASWFDAASGMTRTIGNRKSWTSVHSAGTRIFARTGDGLYELDPSREQFGRLSVPSPAIVRGDGRDLAVLSRDTAASKVTLLRGAASSDFATHYGGDAGVMPTGARILQLVAGGADTLYMLLDGGVLVAYDARNGMRRNLSQKGRVTSIGTFGRGPMAIIEGTHGFQVAFLESDSSPLTLSRPPILTLGGRLVGLRHEGDGAIAVVSDDLSEPTGTPRVEALFRPATVPFANHLQRGKVAVALLPEGLAARSALVVGSQVFVVKSADDVIEFVCERKGEVTDIVPSGKNVWVLDSTGAVYLKELRADDTAPSSLNWQNFGVKRLVPIALGGVLGYRGGGPWEDIIFRPGEAPQTIESLTGAQRCRGSTPAWELEKSGTLLTSFAGSLHVRAGLRPAEQWEEVTGTHSAIGTIETVERLEDGVVVHGVAPDGVQKVKFRLHRAADTWAATSPADAVPSGELLAPILAAGGWLPPDRIVQCEAGPGGQVLLMTAGGNQWSLAPPWKHLTPYEGPAPENRQSTVPTSCVPGKDVVVGRGLSLEATSGYYRHRLPIGIGLLPDGTIAYQDGDNVWRLLSGIAVDEMRPPADTVGQTLPERQLGNHFLVDESNNLRWMPSGAVLGAPSLDVTFDADRWVDVAPSPSVNGAVVLDSRGQVWFLHQLPGNLTFSRQFLGVVTDSTSTGLSLSFRQISPNTLELVVRNPSQVLMTLGSDLTLRPDNGDVGGCFADSSEREGTYSLGNGTTLEWHRDGGTRRFGFSLRDSASGESVPCPLRGAIEAARATAVVALDRPGQSALAFDTALRLTDGRHWVIPTQSSTVGPADWRQGVWAVPMSPSPGPTALVRGSLQFTRKSDTGWSSTVRAGDTELVVPYSEGRFAFDIPLGLATLRENGPGSPVLLTRWRDGLLILDSPPDGARPKDHSIGLLSFPADFSRPAQELVEETSDGVQCAMIQDSAGRWWRIQRTGLAPMDRGPRRFVAGNGGLWKWDETSPRRLSRLTGDQWVPTDLLRGWDGTEALEIDVVRRTSARDLSWDSEPIAASETGIHFLSESGRWLSLDLRIPLSVAPLSDAGRRWVDGGWWQIERSPNLGSDSVQPIRVGGTTSVPWHVRNGRLPFDRVERLTGGPDGHFLAVIENDNFRGVRNGRNSGVDGLSAPNAGTDALAVIEDPAQHPGFGRLLWRGTQVVLANNAGEEALLGDVRDALFPLGDRTRLTPLAHSRSATDAYLTFLNPNWPSGEAFGLSLHAGLSTLDRLWAGTVVPASVDLALDQDQRLRMFLGDDLAWDEDRRAFVPAQPFLPLATASIQRPQFGMLTDGRTDLERSFRIEVAADPAAPGAALLCVRDFGTGPQLSLVAGGGNGSCFDHELPLDLAVQGEDAWLTFDIDATSERIGSTSGLVCVSNAGHDFGPVRATYRSLGGRISGLRVIGSDLSMELVMPEGSARMLGIRVSPPGGPPTVLDSQVTQPTQDGLRVGDLWRVTSIAKNGLPRLLAMEVRVNGSWQPGSWLAPGEGLSGSAVTHAFATSSGGTWFISSEGVVSDELPMDGFFVLRPRAAHDGPGTGLSPSETTSPPEARRIGSRVVVTHHSGPWREILATQNRLGLEVRDTGIAGNAYPSTDAMEAGPWTIYHPTPGSPMHVSVVVPGLNGSARAVQCLAGALDFDRARELFRHNERVLGISPLGPLDPSTGLTLFDFTQDFATRIRTAEVVALASPSSKGVFFVPQGPSGERTIARADLDSRELQIVGPAGLGGLGQVLATVADGSFTLWSEPTDIARGESRVLVGRRLWRSESGKSMAGEARGNALVKHGRLWCDHVLGVFASDGDILGAPASPGTYFATLAGVERVHWDGTSDSARTCFLAPWSGTAQAETPPPSSMVEVLTRLGTEHQSDAFLPLLGRGEADVVVPAPPAEGAPVPLDLGLLATRLGRPGTPVTMSGGFVAGKRLWLVTPLGVTWLELARRWSDSEP